MMKTKSIVASLFVSMIVGQVGIESRSFIEPGVRKQQLSSYSAPELIVQNACGNCHSNHTDWPWYSRVAPISWWIARDVREGRKRLDFSEWETYSTRQKRDKLQSMCGLISTARMPPRLYTAMHPEAKLSEENKRAVCAWLNEQIIVAIHYGGH